jgi:heme exporter protein A
MLQANQLAFAFWHRPIFSDVSFAVAPGQILHVQGPNGAGKSTLLAVVAGLLRPSRGIVSITINGQKLSDQRTALEYLPAEGNGHFLKISGEDNLRFWSALRGLSQLDVNRVLAKWGLARHPMMKTLAVERFSTGMKRRLALARLELSPATCLLLDEPIYGLDEEATQLFVDLLKQKLTGGASVLLVSHELAPFAKLATKSLLLGTGGTP